MYSNKGPRFIVSIIWNVRHNSNRSPHKNEFSFILSEEQLVFTSKFSAVKEDNVRFLSGLIIFIWHKLEGGEVQITCHENLNAVSRFIH